MAFLFLILTALVIGLLLWLDDAQVPMNRMVKHVLNVFIIGITALWLLQTTGLLGPVGSFYLGDAALLAH